MALVREHAMVIIDKKTGQEQKAITVEDMNIDYKINDIVQGQ